MIILNSPHLPTNSTRMPPSGRCLISYSLQMVAVCRATLNYWLHEKQYSVDVLYNNVLTEKPSAECKVLMQEQFTSTEVLLGSLLVVGMVVALGPWGKYLLDMAV